jgi:hypothetical protein
VKITNQLRSDLFNHDYLSQAVVFFRGLTHIIGALQSRVVAPISVQPGSLHRQAVGVIKGFLLNELPTRSCFIGARVSGNVRISISGGDGGGHSMPGMKRG